MQHLPTRRRGGVLPRPRRTQSQNRTTKRRPRTIPVGVDAHIDPAGCNRKFARTIGENAQRPVGADASVRPLGNGKFAATFRKNDCALCGRARHRPLQMLYGFAGVHSCLQVRTAGRTEASAPTGAYRSALVHSKFATVYRAGGVEPLPYAGLTVGCKRRTFQNVQPFSSSVSLREPPSPHGEGFFLRTAPCPAPREIPRRGRNPFLVGQRFAKGRSRPHKLHVPRPAASGRSRSLRCSSSPNCVRSAGTQFGSFPLAVFLYTTSGAAGSRSRLWRVTDSGHFIVLSPRERKGG